MSKERQRPLGCWCSKGRLLTKNKILPTLSASSTAVFTSIGLTASSIYSVFVGLIGTAVDFMLWLIQVGWPFLLGIAFIYLMKRMAYRFVGFGRH